MRARATAAAAASFSRWTPHQQPGRSLAHTRRFAARNSLRRSFSSSTQQQPQPQSQAQPALQPGVAAQSCDGGSWTFDEFQEMSKRRGLPFLDAELRYAFDEADEDGNGILSADEVRRTLARLTSGLWALMPALKAGIVRSARQSHLAALLLRARLTGDLPTESKAERHDQLIKTAAVEVSKVVPFMTIVLFVPGAPIIVPAMLAYCPAAVPSAFSSVAAVMAPNKQQEATESDSGPCGRELDEFQKLTLEVLERLPVE
eukprot:CAMPEP_0206458684 /NCGR_PEP_ID=MMETSP0324_2-20121206/23716_1 /ASSEMBLY_ACC=CAM_ASM_000836 /TAXON_ID=2866 /ORGANISM="Crypthecodinium cohnii, Strain Seligo" /LENGTH=258 /DNA_ID=CAMNT_0053930069 /DNA_START=396 /DNA_END=1172 /DNA_ORIENTATION=-